MREIIRQKITDRGTVEEFGKSIGMRTATLYDYLNGRVDIRISTLKNILDPLNISYMDFLNGNSKFKPLKAFGVGMEMYYEGSIYNGLKISTMYGSESHDYIALIFSDGGLEIVKKESNINKIFLCKKK